MMHKAWCSIEEVPYCFPRSSIKFQGQTGWKIDDLDQIWARLLGRSQLSNPSDLPCLLNATHTKILIYIEKNGKKCLGPGPRAPMVATPMKYNILYHYSTLIWHRYLVLPQVSPGLTYFTCQYHGYWCPGDVRSQGISSHDINLVKPR